MAGVFFIFVKVLENNTTGLGLLKGLFKNKSLIFYMFLFTILITRLHKYSVLYFKSVLAHF